VSGSRGRTDPRAKLLATIDTSVNNVFAEINATLPAKLPQNATVAIFPITADSADHAEVALENLTTRFVNEGYTVVEKRRVEELLAEYDFQLSGLVGEKTLGELLGADAVIFSMLARSGHLRLWAVDTAKRITLAKVVPEPEAIPTVEYPPPPPPPQGNENYYHITEPWAEEIKRIARENPAAPFAPRPYWVKAEGLSLERFLALELRWKSAKEEVRPKKDVTLFQITGGSNNEAETIQSFLANCWIQNNYTLYDRSGDTEYSQYAESFAGYSGLPYRQQDALRAMTDSLMTGSVQQIGRKNMLILNTLSSSQRFSMNMDSFDYADSLELWVKLQATVAKIVRRERPRDANTTRTPKNASIYSQFGAGVNRAEAEMLTQLLISDTGSIPIQSFVIDEFTDATRDIEAGGQAPAGRFTFNWSRSGNRTRLDATRDGKRYSIEYGSQREFIRKMRGLSVFVLSCLGTQIQGFEGYDLSAGEAARVPANFTKLTRVVNTRQGTPMGGFYIGNAPVTQREYETIMKKNPSFAKNPSQPVNNVSIIDAMIFCNQMSIRDDLEPAYLIEGSSTVTVDNFASGYRLATTDEWRYARDKIEGMGVLAEYVYDGKLEEGAKILANGWNGEIPYNEGSWEFNASASNYDLKSFEQDIGEGTGPIANTRRIRRTAVIRLVRPILDFWKFTSGQEAGSFYLGR
jgi:hypothetical protein